jgi:hypothetical protein
MKKYATGMSEEAWPMTRCGSLVIALLCVSAVVAAVVDDARAQNCESMAGPARTDCFIGRARILGHQSQIARGAARVRTDEEFLRAVTGGSVAPKLHRAKSKYRVPPRPRSRKSAAAASGNS